MELRVIVFVTLICLGTVIGQFEEEEDTYRGLFIGSLNSYHHQVSGEVYAVDDDTLMLHNFVYDGNGKDTFFWAGSSNRPSSKGYIVPDKNGRTNILGRYLNEDFILKLPSLKKISDLKWFSVFDLSTQTNFGDIYIREGFEPPGYQTLTEIYGDLHSVSSQPVVVMDAKTIKIPGFTYDGKGGDVYFFAGEGPQPSSKGFIVPDELGYLAPIGLYKKQDVVLQLPGSKSIFDIDWIAVYNQETRKSLGHVIVPESLNVPPSLVKVMEHDTGLDNCMMLHRNMMVSWDSRPPQLTIKLAGHIDDDEYMAFGISGEQGKSVMTGGDVVVAYMDEYLGHADDYNLTAKSVCHKVLGLRGGACNDELLGGINSAQLHEATKKDGVTEITYRTTFGNLDDPGDIVIPQDVPTSIIWAIGKMAEVRHRVKEPSFHHTYTRKHTQINFTSKEKLNTCFPFTSNPENTATRWNIPPIFDPTKRSFSARLGPAGGKRGYSGQTGLPTGSLVWYMEGFLAPELYLRRGLTYTFKIEGGNNPRSEDYYHPFIITDEPVGGYYRMTEEQRSQVRVLAGVKFTIRKVPNPVNNVGRKCVWEHGLYGDRRRDDEFKTFSEFRNSLGLTCDEGEPALLQVTPNVTWPNVVYYNSYTTPYMGWKIHIVDNFRQRPRSGSASERRRPAAVTLMTGLVLSSWIIRTYWI